VAKNHIFSNPALKQKNSPNTSFNLVTKTTNFNSIFDVKPLEEGESALIEHLLVKGANPGSHSEQQVHTDIKMLKALTAEIKAIGKQGALLMGERIAKAREVLKSYHNGTFTKWLDSICGSLKTGYNLLCYYDFYSALAEPNLKEKFRKFPQKIAYILASRQGDMKKKEEIVRWYEEQTPIELISMIQEKLPIAIQDKRARKDDNVTRIEKMKSDLQDMLQSKQHIPAEAKTLLQDIRDIIDTLLTSPAKNAKVKKQ
jgi:hypothetical protein